MLLCFSVSLHSCQQFWLLKGLLGSNNDISYVEVARSHIHRCVSNSCANLKRHSKTWTPWALLIFILHCITSLPLDVPNDLVALSVIFTGIWSFILHLLANSSSAFTSMKGQARRKGCIEFFIFFFKAQSSKVFLAPWYSDEVICYKLYVHNGWRYLVPCWTEKIRWHFL